VLAVERRETITRLLQKQGAVRVADLSEKFGVSLSTIRRDLQKLAQQGLIERSYGGATWRDTREVKVTELKDTPLTEEKDRIGRRAANLLVPGETVFLGAGSTVLAVARALTGRDDLTVITSGLSVAAYLAAHSAMELVVVGGLVHRQGSAMTGHLAEQALEGLHATQAILGVQGISTIDGLTSDDLSQVRMIHRLLETIPQVTVVADHTKFGRICTAHIAPVDRADVIVTGRQAPSATLWELAELDVKVILV
jgi:DeoR/GlpR family transcriptional regulator of sugar metabolism